MKNLTVLGFEKSRGIPKEILASAEELTAIFQSFTFDTKNDISDAIKNAVNTPTVTQKLFDQAFGPSTGLSH